MRKLRPSPRWLTTTTTRSKISALRGKMLQTPRHCDAEGPRQFSTPLGWSGYQSCDY